MGTQIRLFFNGIANSLNPEGYYNIVTPPRKLGESTRIISRKTKKAHKNKSFMSTNARRSIATTAE